jgi:hypothetical protein
MLGLWSATSPPKPMQILAAPFVSLAGDYQSIATTTVGVGGAATITFSSIPSTYSNLQIRGISRVSSGATSSNDILIRFNSDTAANYSIHYLFGSGAAASAAGTTSTTYSYATRASTPRNGSTANAFGSFVVDIFDYANSNKFKTVRGFAGIDTNDTNGIVSLASGNWRSTTAITRIDLTDELGGNFSQYSSFALYGIKG